MEDKVHRPGLPGARETRPVGSLRRFLPDTKPYRWQFVVAAVISLGVVLAQTAGPEIVKRFIDEVLSGKHPQRLLPYALTSLALGVVSRIGDGREALDEVASAPAAATAEIKRRILGHRDGNSAAALMAGEGEALDVALLGRRED